MQKSVSMPAACMMLQGCKEIAAYKLTANNCHKEGAILNSINSCHCHFAGELSRVSAG
jgi:hypothetical protein